ncbi:invasion associated locus B family protein [Pluralibacter gergoviae]|nr:invasion associated locus B family protein [Pluralibacter gergoviae]ELC3016672.1 invasion associated locus B family protein [Pluralibacter gergoviae]ELC3022181.1 invasion associated locus B family protein [Pluralibacter gergoviae]
MKGIGGVALLPVALVIGCLAGYALSRSAAPVASVQTAAPKANRPDALDARYQSWHLNCASRGPESASCEVSASLVEQGRTLGNITLVPNPHGAKLMLRLPLGIDVQSGVIFTLLGRKTEGSKQLSVSRCDAEGCLSILDLPQPLFNSLSEIGEIRTRVRTLHNGPQITLNCSAAGLAPALLAMNAWQ